MRDESVRGPGESYSDVILRLARPIGQSGPRSDAHPRRSSGLLVCNLHLLPWRRRPTARSLATAQGAYDAICATLAVGSVAFEVEADERGERLVLLDPNVVNRLKAMRGPRESYSDVILKLAAGGHERSRS